MNIPLFGIVDSMHEYDQWTEIEDDAKKLHQIVQTQKNQINEIVALISESGKRLALGSSLHNQLVLVFQRQWHPVLTYQMHPWTVPMGQHLHRKHRPLRIVVSLVLF